MGDSSVKGGALRPGRVCPPRSLSSHATHSSSGSSSSSSGSGTNSSNIATGLVASTSAHIPDGHSGTITAIRYSDDGSLLVSASADKTARVYRLGDDQDSSSSPSTPPTVLLQGHGKGVNDVVWLSGSPAPFAATASDDASVRLWDVSQGRVVRTLWDSDVAFCLAAHPTQNVLLAGTVTEKFKIIDFRMAAPLVCSVQAHNNVVSSIAVDPSGPDFITASLDGTARVWDIGSARCFKSFLSEDFAPISHIQYGHESLKGSLLVSTLAGRHELWLANTHTKLSEDVESNEKRPVAALRRYEGHRNASHCIAACLPFNYSANHPRVLASGSESGEVFFWDLDSEELLARLDAASAASDNFQAGSDHASSRERHVPAASSASAAPPTAAALAVACHPSRPHEYAVGVSGPEGHAVQLWHFPILHTAVGSGDVDRRDAEGCGDAATKDFASNEMEM